MKILAIDTSSKTQLLALSSGSNLLGEIHLESLNSHTETLLLNIDQLLKESNLQLGDIDLFTAIAGPGSFTGLRIGISSIKAIAYAMNKPVIGISRLLAMSYPFLDKHKKLFSVMVAPFENFFCGAFHYGKEKNILTMIPPQLMDQEIFKKKIASFLEHEIVLLSDEHELNQINDLMINSQIEIMPVRISAEHLIELSQKLYSQGKIQTADQLFPLYLRPSEAERKLKAHFDF